MKSGLYTFGIGFVAGVACALLFAPQSGEETRDMLADKARRGIDEGSKRIREAADQGAEAVQKARRQVQDAIETGKAAYSKAASAIE